MDSGLDHKLQNKQIQDALIASIKAAFPIINKDKKLELINVRFKDNLDDLDFPQQKEAHMARKSWQNPIIADLAVIDTTTDRVISKAKDVKIGNIPKITNRFTTIIDGNEYQTVNQIRRKSGVYSRIKMNGELESEFNLIKGQNFKMQLEPITQHFVISFENRKYRLWTLLNVLGVDDSEIRKFWGDELLEINKRGALNTEVSEMTSIYKKVYKHDPKDYAEVIKGLQEYFLNYTTIDKETTAITLGKSFEKVDGSTLLAASKKLLKINRNEDTPDERDSLIFKRVFSVDDSLVAYFDKQTPLIKKKLERSLGLKDQVREIISAATFGEPVKRFFTVGDLSSTPPQTNPVTIAAEWRKTTPMGTGGIQSSHAITMDARDIQPTHLGFLDPLATPESLKVGVTVGLTSEVKKVGNDLVTPVVDLQGKLHWFSPIQFYNEIIGFPDQYEYVNNKVTPTYSKIKTMYKGETKEFSKQDVKYYLRSPRTMLSYQANLLPFIHSTQGNRAATGARMITQALSLDQKEAPLVRTYRDVNSTYEDVLGSYLNPVSDVNGTIAKIDKDYVYVKTTDKKTRKIGLYNNFPLNQDGWLQSTPLVKVGDQIKVGQVIADNNYSNNQTLSLGKNLNVAYMSYKGYNFEDGAVMTESAAKKMSHSMLHRINVFFSPKLSVFNKQKFNAWFSDEISPENFNKLDERGLIKIGETVNPDDIVCAFLVERDMDDIEQTLKKLDKYTFNNYTHKIAKWDEEDVGIVTDVRINGRNIDIYIKSAHPLKEGDKIVGRYGNKSIITKVIPDSDAPYRPNGEPIDLILSPEGVPGRMNIGQILETAAAKVANKTGKPYIVNNFEKPELNAAKEVYDELKKYNIPANEVLTDGKTGQKIETPIFVGKQYIMKLRHIVKKKQGAHNFGAYDTDEQPTGKGVQKIGILDSYAYLAHGAKNNLREFSEIKGRKNEDYWRDLQFGIPPGKPNRNFVFDKMVSYLKGAGVNVEKQGTKLRIFPLTDDDVTKMSAGELTDPGAMLIGKNLTSRKGGLFDPIITGGTKGTNWSHITLVDKIPNPMYEDAIMKILDMTEKDFNDVLYGKKEFNNKKGIVAIVDGLKNIDVDAKLKNLKIVLKTAPPTNVNKLNTKIKYLEALKDLNLTPYNAYTIHKLPIIPPQFRSVYPLPSGDLIVSDINKHYRDVGLINKNLKNVYNDLLDKDKIEGQVSLYNSVKALQGFIEPITYSKEKYKGFVKELGEMKTGLIQGVAWTKPQDLSGRSTITVEPDLGLDEVGIPNNMAYTLYKPFIIRELKQSGMKVTDAKKYYDEENPLAKNALAQVIKYRPVILNRAPSLHKHSVQAFKPILTSGKSIKLNPLIIKGFNADFDGDTMSLMVPISHEAVEEAKAIMPSKILFKHGDNQLMPRLTKDYIYGLWSLSKITDKINKNFSSIEAAKNSGIKWTTEFKLNGKPMTIGQYMINAELPTKYRNYERTLDSHQAEKLLVQLGKEDPQYFSNVINSWKNLGATYSYIKGHTISITDFTADKKYRDDLLKANLPSINKLPNDKKIDELNKLTLKVQEAQKSILSKNNYIGDMLNSGSFDKVDSVRQILSMPGVMQDINGNPISIPILKSYGEGLDTSSYWNTLYGVRKGTVDRAVNTQQSGDLNKTLLNVNRKLLIVQEDCGTDEGLSIDVNDKNVMDRALLNTVPKVGRRNDIVTNIIIQKAKQNGATTLKVRSPLTCHSIDGVCQLCYGLMPNGQLPSIGTNVGILESQAVTEVSTQLTMKTFHSGGSALVGGGVAAGFPRIEQLLKVPEKLSGKATLSEEDGIVNAIVKNITGGYSVKVNTTDYIIPPGRMPIVKIGQYIKKGEPVSDGVLKPQELGDLTNHLNAQLYIVKELNKIYQNKFFNKSFETILRGTSDTAEITKTPDNINLLRGDKVSISYIDSINRDRKRKGEELVEYKPYFKSIATLNTDSDDWLTRLTTNRVKSNLMLGAAKAQYSNIKGKDPIPAYLYGDNFGKNVDYEKGEFY